MSCHCFEKQLNQHYIRFSLKTGSTKTYSCSLDMYSVAISTVSEVMTVLYVKFEQFVQIIRTTLTLIFGALCLNLL